MMEIKNLIDNAKTHYSYAQGVTYEEEFHSLTNAISDLEKAIILLRQERVKTLKDWIESDD